jgi:hypothetical protein
MTDMSRNLLIMPVLISLLGCQMPATLQPGAQAAEPEPACYVSNDALTDLLRQQYQYLNGSGQTRRKQLAQAVKSRDKALEAMLLTSPAASAEQFSRGNALLASLPLYPDQNCMADRYLYLQHQQYGQRQQQQQQLQQQLQQLQAQDAQIIELKRKIEALTDLEKEITRQRKDL